MKRIVLIGLIAMLALSVACGRSTENIGEAGNVLGAHEIPEQIIFNSLEEYRAFAASLELDDKDFQRFINNNHYSMNGVHTKADVKKVLDVMDSMPVANIDGFVFDSSNVRFDIGTCYILFKDDVSQNNYLAFNISIETSDVEADKIADLKSGKIVDFRPPNDSELKYLLKSDRQDIHNINTYYLTNIRLHRTELITNMSDDELLDLLYKCRFTTMGEYAKKAAP